MCRLLRIALVIALSAIPSHAQRAMSSGHSAGSSVSRGFTPAPHVIGGLNRGGFTSGIRSAPVGTLTSRRFNALPTYRRNTLIPSGGVSKPQTPYGNGHGSPFQNWRHVHGGRYRQPYPPYFYANSTYLVPGLLNSYWDSPDYQDGFNGSDRAPYFDQQPNQDNNYFQPDPAPDYGNGDQGQRTGQGPRSQSKDVPPPPPAPSEPPPLAALTLIFKDGHSQQIHNYAMTQTKLYVVDGAAAGRSLEIPLSAIDLQATKETNQQSGVDFSIPYR
jgi:hypothetical protein